MSEEAPGNDLSSVERRGIVTICTDKDDTSKLLQDKDGNAIVVLIPKNVPNETGAWEKAFSLFLRTMQQITCNYRILYVHSGFDSPLGFAWWVGRLRHRVSDTIRKNLKAVTVLHPTILVRLCFWSLKPFVSAKFWEKLHYADRIEELFLDDVLPKEAIPRVLPQFVISWEQGLVEEGKIARHVAVQAGAPLGPNEN